VARTIAEPDRKYGASQGAVEAVAEAFFDLMAQRKFVDARLAARIASTWQHYVGLARRHRAGEFAPAR
jgi:hypothetical protein